MAKQWVDLEKLRDKAMKLGVKKGLVTKLFGKKRATYRKAKIWAKHEKQLHATLSRLWKKTQGSQEITAEDVHTAWKAKTCSVRTVRRWLGRNYEWKRPQNRPQHTEQDVKDRQAFGRKNKDKKKQFWRKLVYIDGHTFPKLSSVRSQSLFGRTKVRGQYTPKGPKRYAKFVTGVHTREGKKHRVNFGGAFSKIVGCSYEKGVFFMENARVGGRGKAPVWDHAAAKTMYQKLRARFPDIRDELHILEENDRV